VDAARAAPGGPGVRREPALNADPSAQLRLLDVQQLDARLDQLAHRRATLPELAEIGALAAEQLALRDRIVAAETDESDISREVAKAEGDVEQVRARAERDQKRLDAGQVSSPRELENLQHEITSLARRQADLEEAELDVMQRLEDVQTLLIQVRAQQADVDQRLAAAAARRDAIWAEIDTEVADLATQRAEFLPEVPDALQALYEKLRAANGGVGAAALRQRRCEGCRLELNTTDVNRIRTAAVDEVVRCEECGRILVRTADSGL
jgi:predicted  nucleic acid-binding Zn-ribbon protein